MLQILLTLLCTARSSLRSRRELVLENLALRQQLAVLGRRAKRPKLTATDRAFWGVLARLWPGWQSALTIVKPATVIGWHRKGIEQVVNAPRSPWQNPYVERVIGTIRRECTDHLIVLGEHHLRGILRRFVAYYNEDRTPIALDKDAPTSRPVQQPVSGTVVALPRVGGLHYRYERRAA